MKIYKYKNDNGDLIKSVYPKPTDNEKIIAEGIISIIILVIILVGLTILLFNS